MLKIPAAPNIIPAFDGRMGLRTEAARRLSISMCAGTG
jgi:hypothetical protein